MDVLGRQATRREFELHRRRYGDGGRQAAQKRAAQNGAHHERLTRHQNAADEHHQLCGPLAARAHERAGGRIPRRPQAAGLQAQKAHRRSGRGEQGHDRQPAGERRAVQHERAFGTGGRRIRRQAGGGRADACERDAGKGAFLLRGRCADVARDRQPALQHLQIRPERHARLPDARKRRAARRS